MKNLIIIVLSVYSLALTILWVVLSSDNNRLRWENRELNSMCDTVVEYADSTADTGEMDDFIQSKSGQYFFETYNSINGK